MRFTSRIRLVSAIVCAFAEVTCDGGPGAGSGSESEVSTAVQESVVAEFDRAAAVLVGQSAVPPDPTVVSTSRDLVKAHPSGPTLLRAVAQVMRSSRAGHQEVATEDLCSALSAEYPKEHHSRFGVCGRPYRDGIVITHSRDGNRLGLALGDWVTSVDGIRGAQLFEFVLKNIACGTSVLSASAVRETAAASLFATVLPGAHLEVTSPSGSSRSVVIPDTGDPAWTSCTDPWGVTSEVVSGTRRNDGVTILSIRRFRSIDSRDSEFSAKMRQIISGSAGAPLVVDVRGNAGGYGSLLTEVLSLLPGMRAGKIGSCSSKSSGATAEPAAPFEAPPSQPMVTKPSNVVALTDGLAFSAGDAFPLLAQRFGNVPVVGTPTQGELNYGATAEPVKIDGPFPLFVTPTLSVCFDDNGEPLAGSGARVDRVVELDPKDVARGIDTQLEAAVAVALERQPR